jgi:L-glutamine-phosphate cytidylyltransferase
MKAIILAAGKGTRMGDLTKESPKCTLDFFGKTLIDRQIKVFQETGITDITIVTGFMSHKITNTGCKMIKNEQYGTTNMVESLFCTRALWDDEIVVSYGDIIYEQKVLERLIKRKENFNVVIDLNGESYFRDRFGDNFLSETESLVMDKDRNILEIGEPNPELLRVQGQYIGLMKFSSNGLNIMSTVYDNDKKEYWDKPWLRSKSLKEGYMTDMLQRIIDLGNEVKAVCIEGGWLEFDTKEDYAKYLMWKDNKELGRYYSIDE